MKIAIIGCGAIGRKRAQACKDLGHEIIGAADIMIDRAVALAKDFGTPNCYVGTDRGILSMEPIPQVVICGSYPNSIPHHARCAAERGSHVFMEKPAARRADELDGVCAAAQKTGALIRVGYNLRFHPAIQQARRWIEEIGPIMYITGRYGHGGRVGYEKEWRMNRWNSGGGVAMDMGVHLVDLARVFLGGLVCARSLGAARFWESRVEDNMWLSLAGPYERISAWLHASWTEWRNRFEFEIAGLTGKISIEGLGGSYGVEKVTLYKMRPEMGPPDITSHEYPREDDSWRRELIHFFHEIEYGRKDSSPEDFGATLADAQAVLRIMESAGCCIPAGATPETV